MRLAAQAKMGYYPTPASVVSRISDILARDGRGTIRLLDPCAGEGHALKHIGESLKAETYGIELDRERGRIARENLTHCLITDYEATRISNQAFSLLYLNPPYDWAIRNDEVSASERYERTFLRNTIRYLIPDGILVYLIPQSRLDKNIATILSYRFKDIRLFRFPDEEYQSFKQVVIFGVLKKRSESDDELTRYLIEAGQGQAIIPSLDTSDCNYTVPLSSPVKTFLFRTTQINPEELATELKHHGLRGTIDRIVCPLSLSERIKPIMPLRHGHLAQLLACGMMNGVVVDKEGGNPLLVKGITKKVVDTRTEHEDGKERIIETDRIVITINAINENGDLITIT
jgi:tRNA1(Val) A37 N6-methylase TrmN6